MVCWGYGAGEQPYWYGLGDLPFDKGPTRDSARFAGPYADLASASGLGFCASNAPTEGRSAARRGCYAPWAGRHHSRRPCRPASRPPAGRRLATRPSPRAGRTSAHLRPRGGRSAGRTCCSGSGIDWRAVGNESTRSRARPLRRDRRWWPPRVRAHRGGRGGLLATPPTTSSRLPTHRPGATSPSATGAFHTCALTEDGRGSMLGMEQLRTGGRCRRAATSAIRRRRVPRDLRASPSRARPSVGGKTRGAG